MIYIKIVEQHKDTPGWKEVEISELTDTGIGMLIGDCKHLLDELEDAHRAIMDEEKEV